MDWPEIIGETEMEARHSQARYQEIVLLGEIEREIERALCQQRALLKRFERMRRAAVFFFWTSVMLLALLVNFLCYR